jgi:hypothetical protein
MYQGKILFTQIMEYIPRKAFDNIVALHRGDYKHKDFSCRDQFLAMAFAQLTLRSSLRGIESTLRANGSLLYHMGFRCATVSRNTLANANEHRPWRMWQDIAQRLMRKAQRLYADETLVVDVDARIFAMDSTTIDLCLERFPWAIFREAKGAVKVHVLLELRGNIPDFIVITDGKTHDVNILDQMAYLPGAFYLLDRGYIDFLRLHRLHQSGAFFVTRAKRRLRFTVIESRRVEKATGPRCDQTIRLAGTDTAAGYPERLRRVKYRDPETGKTLVFLTNNFLLPAKTIADLYRQRWQVELFFKWIKQHLRIKAFYGYSANAVRTQIWVAVAVYCLLAIIKKELGGDRNLYEIQEILSASIFRKMPILQAFSDIPVEMDEPGRYNPPSLFDL